MTRRSKREIERKLEEIADRPVGEYPHATLIDVFKSEEVNVERELDDGYLLAIDGEKMGMSHSMAQKLGVENDTKE